MQIGHLIVCGFQIAVFYEQTEKDIMSETSLK